PRHKFGMYPRIRTLFEQRADQYHHYQTKHREDELLIKVEEALRQLERLRMPLTQKNICAIVGKSPDALRRYPRVKDLLQQHNRLSQSRKRFLAKIKGDELHQRIEAIIRELEDLGQSVTLAAICSRIGIRQEELIHYPQIETLIKQIKENYRQHRLEQAK